MANVNVELNIDDAELEVLLAKKVSKKLGEIVDMQIETIVEKAISKKHFNNIEKKVKECIEQTYLDEVSKCVEMEIDRKWADTFYGLNTQYKYQKDKYGNTYYEKNGVVYVEANSITDEGRAFFDGISFAYTLLFGKEDKTYHENIERKLLERAAEIIADRCKSTSSKNALATALLMVATTKKESEE